MNLILVPTLNEGSQYKLAHAHVSILINVPMLEEMGNDAYFRLSPVQGLPRNLLGRIFSDRKLAAMTRYSIRLLLDANKDILAARNEREMANYNTAPELHWRNYRNLMDQALNRRNLSYARLSAIKHAVAV